MGGSAAILVLLRLGLVSGTEKWDDGACGGWR
jgi:hypothetical protein